MLLALRHIVEARAAAARCRPACNRGPVFTGEVGPAYRRWYAVMGDTVNLAARLVAKAPAGRIYATRDVLRRAKASFAATALEPFQRQGEVAAGSGVGRGSAEVCGPRTQRIGPRLPLVGRDHELEQLRRAIDARAARPRER